MDNQGLTSLSDSKLARRQVLTRAAGMGGALALLSGSGLAQASTTRGRASAAKRGGTLIFSSTTAPPSLDPPRYGVATVAYNLFDRLVAIDPITQAVTPAMLERLPVVTRAGKLYTFKLKPGLKFSDGSALTSADVKFTLERLVKPDSELSSTYAALGIVGTDALLAKKTKTLSGIKIVDARTFTVELAAANSSTVPLLGMQYASIVSKAAVQKLGDSGFGKRPLGSGPFMLKSMNSKSIELVRNPNYREPGLPYLDGIRWDIGVASDLAVLRIQRGQQDVQLSAVPAASYDQLRSDPSHGGKLLVVPQNAVIFISLNVKHPAMSNVKVRQALAMAVDKVRLVRLLKGLGTAATGGIFTPESPYYTQDLAYGYDPAAAKKLLAEAGYPNGFDVDFYGASDVDYHVLEGQSLKQDFGQIGVNLNVQLSPLSAYDAVASKSPPAIITYGWELAYPHGSYIADGAFTSKALAAGCCNYPSVVDPNIDRLAAEGRRAVTVKQQERVYRALDKQVVHNDVVWVPMFYQQWAELVSNRVQGYKISRSAAGSKDFTRVWLGS